MFLFRETGHSGDRSSLCLVSDRDEAAAHQREGLVWLAGNASGMLLAALALFGPVLFHHRVPNNFALEAPLILTIAIGGGLPMAVLRVLMPEVTIRSSRTSRVIKRTMKARQVRLALTTLAFIAGTVGWWWVTQVA